MIAVPAWLDQDAWDGFCQMRRSMGKSKPFTDRASLLILRRLQEIKSAGHCPNAALDQSTLHGWAGVWPAKQEQIEPARTSDADRTAAYLASEAEHRRALRAVR